MKLNSGRDTIFVDGKDTLHVVCHILKANGVDTEAKTRGFEVEDIGDFKTFFELVDAELKVASQRSVGFIIDAENSASSRWTQTVCNASALPFPPWRSDHME